MPCKSTTRVVGLGGALAAGMARPAEPSPGYLAGDWCHTHVQFGEQREDEGRLYRFETDGTFSQQVDSRSGRMQSGFRYRISPGTLALKPVFPGEMPVVSVGDDRFVLKWFGEMHFMRGPCP